jgi:AcrR family transcriptional regulator
MTRPHIEPRKAPRQRRAQDTVAYILEAAAHILEEHGLEGYNTNAVAKRAGVSIGSLYQYFPNKDSLSAALSRQSREQLLQDLDDMIARTAGQEFDVVLGALCEVAVAQQIARPNASRLIDILEERLPMETDNRSIQMAIAVLISSVIQRGYPSLSPEQLAVVTRDVIFIARGMIDGAAKETDAQLQDLPQRLHLCVKAYLSAISAA